MKWRVGMKWGPLFFISEPLRYERPRAGLTVGLIAAGPVAAGFSGGEIAWLYFFWILAGLLILLRIGLFIYGFTRAFKTYRRKRKRKVT